MNSGPAARPLPRFRAGSAAGMTPASRTPTPAYRDHRRYRRAVSFNNLRPKKDPSRYRPEMGLVFGNYGNLVENSRRPTPESGAGPPPANRGGKGCLVHTGAVWPWPAGEVKRS